MTTFGDDDLFDAWDDNDHLVIKVLLLLAIGHHLQAHPDPIRRAEAKRLLLKLSALRDKFDADLAEAADLIETS